MDAALRDANNAHSAVELRRLFLYDVSSGKLYWKVNKGRARQGEEAGTKHNKGYLSVEVDGTAYLVHRLIWCLVKGSWPDLFIDHENLDKADNRWSNLREATRSNNNSNQRLRKDSSSGVKGVTWHKKSQKWQARVQVDGVRHHLGFFDKQEDAETAATTARARLHKEYTNNG